jgi:predicted permease
VRQLLIESLVQAFAAGAIGLAIAIWGTGALVALSPPDVPRLGEVAINARVLVFTVALCTLVSILFGLPPALAAARRDVHEGLSRTTGRVAGGGHGRTREILVVAEIALAVVLVMSSALLVRSLIALQHAPLGFQPEHVLVMQATAPPRVPDWSDSRAFFEGLLQDIRELPGVVAVGAAMGPPGRTESESGYWIDRMPEKSALSSARPAVMNVIAPGTFAALGVPMHRGRDFRQADRSDAPQVAIVNEALAHAAFRGRDPIGAAIVAGYDSMAPMTIVGVVGNVRQHGPALEPQPEIYMPYQQHFYNGATLHVLVRTSTDPTTLAASIERKARHRSPRVSVRVTTMEAVLREHMATPQFRAWLLSLFAGIALVLALAGVYGVMTFVANQRTKEIGVRIALGADPGSILLSMVGRGLKLTVIGLGLGVLGAAVSTRLLSGMLFNVKPTDVTTFAAVLGALGALSLLAMYLPARRASRTDPVLVLRQD